MIEISKLMDVSLDELVDHKVNKKETIQNKHSNMHYLLVVFALIIGLLIGYNIHPKSNQPSISELPQSLKIVSLIFEETDLLNRDSTLKKTLITFSVDHSSTDFTYELLIEEKSIGGEPRRIPIELVEDHFELETLLYSTDTDLYLVVNNGKETQAYHLCMVHKSIDGGYYYETNL